jgi:hypothetical protein
MTAALLIVVSSPALGRKTTYSLGIAQEFPIVDLQAWLA